MEESGGRYDSQVERKAECPGLARAEKRVGAAKVRLLNCNLAGTGLSVLYLLTGGFFCPARSGCKALSGRYRDIAPGTRMQFMG